MDTSKMTYKLHAYTGYVPDGTNEWRWHLMEHQAFQALHSCSEARRMLEDITDYPENQDERDLAIEIMEHMTQAYVALLSAWHNTQALISGTETAQKMGGYENEDK